MKSAMKVKSLKTLSVGNVIKLLGIRFHKKV